VTPMNDEACAACGGKPMVPTNVRRMPMPLVVLGFLLMVVSVLGLGFGALISCGQNFVAQQRARTPDEVRHDLESASVPPPIVDKVLADPPERVTMDERKSLNATQLVAVQKAELAAISKEVDPEDMKKASREILIGSMIGLVLGWFLRSKRPGLRCPTCSATVAV